MALHLKRLESTTAHFSEGTLKAVLVYDDSLELSFGGQLYTSDGKKLYTVDDKELHASDKDL